MIAPGSSKRDHRAYLKAVAAATWDLVNWLTHYAEATAYVGHVACQATQHALTNWSVAVMVHDADGGPPRCPVCGSYRLRVDYEQGDGFGVLEVLVCGKCGWEGNGLAVEPEPSAPNLAPRDGECITVKVPLVPPFKGAKPPK